MKTLQIGMGWFPEQSGGLNRFYYDCIRYLPQAGVATRGLVAGSAKVLPSSDGQVQAFASSNSSLIWRWWQMRRSLQELLRREDDALVVSHFALYTFPVLDMLGQRPLVTHFHGPWAFEGDVEGKAKLATPVKRTLEQITYQRSAEFIVLSQTFGNVLCHEYRVPQERIHVIPGAVDNRFDIALSRTEARTQLGWTQERPIIFCVRRLVKRMGLENLLVAISQVRPRFPDILLYIAGKGPLLETLQTQIQELDLTTSVRLLGYIADEQLPVAYRAADFSIVPTLALEGFGLIVVESLAAGTPVLGTPVGGIPEILQPFCTDLVLEGSSSEQLAQGISEALSGQRYLPDSHACKTYVQKHYTWSAIAPQIKSVYQSALRSA